MPVIIEEDFGDFDWESTEGGKYPPLPEGWYPVRISKAAVKTVDGKQGPFDKLVLTMEVLEGQHKGRLIFDDVILNDKPGSKKRRAIIWRRLGLVQKGARKAAISEEDLVGRECTVEVEVEEYPRKDGTQGTKNVVTFAGYKPVEEVGAEATLTEEECPF